MSFPLITNQHVSSQYEVLRMGTTHPDSYALCHLAKIRQTD